MSMISEQVNLLRDAVIRLQALDLPNTAIEVKEAADTIEELSAKLASANMERSTAYYNDGWISVSEGLPKYTQDYNVTVGVGNPFVYYETVMTFRFVRIGNREPKWIIPNDNNIYTVLAWRELPAKYKPNGEK